MKIGKSKFSKIQEDFLGKLARCLQRDFKGEQLALAHRIGCDHSSVSRWVNWETAPPDYVCRLLLKELATGSFKQVMGQRVQYLREHIFRISLREFALAFPLEDGAQVEAIENGDVLLPRSCMEALMRDYRVCAEYLDYGEGGIFAKIPHNRESILSFLKEGFSLFIVTAPHGSDDRSWLKCQFVLHRKREYLPQCVVTQGVGSFKSTGGGLLLIEYALQDALDALVKDRPKFMDDMPPVPTNIPKVLMANPENWKALYAGNFYQKEILFDLGCADDECRDKLDKIIGTMAKNRKKSGNEPR